MCAVSVENYDVLLFTETFLDCQIDNNELGLQNFQIFRCDRSQRTSCYSRGGGVLVAVRRHLSAIELPSSIDNIEHLFVSISTQGSRRQVMGVVYIPPSSPPEVYKSYCESVSSVLQEFMCEDCDITLCGDFNLPNVTWSNDEYGATPHGTVTQQVIYLSNCVAFFNLKQVNAVSNAKGRCLDLIFTSVETEICQVDCPLLVCDKYHPALTFSVINTEINSSARHYDYFFYDFKLADYHSIGLYLSYVDWELIFKDADINIVVDRFYEVVNYVIELYVPKRRAKTPKFPNWFSSDLRCCMIQKKIAHKNYKQSNSLTDYHIFSRLRSECKTLAVESHLDYVRNLESSIQSKKEFWKYVNSRKDSGGLPNCMSYNGTKSETLSETANLFARHFSSAYSVHTDKDVTFNYAKTVDLNSCNITVMDVFNAMSGLDDRLGCGPDHIPVHFLKNTRYILSEVLCKMFNMSLSTGTFPDRWKVSFITPIFKGGVRSDISNYRPISKLSVIPKLFELIVAGVISPHFTHILSPDQHGFIKKKSTLSNLMIYQHRLLKSVEHHCQVDSVSTDFSKAFDRLNIYILLKKLDAVGVGGSLVKWLSSFLVGRTQYVKLGDAVSTCILVHSGVPQGGHLSPLLFNLYINDVENVIHFASKLLYADDLKLFTAVDTMFQCEQLQQDLDRFALWCDVNDLTLNIDKCKTTTFFKTRNPIIFQYRINNETLDRVDSLKDLGVTFSSDLRFTAHIENLTNRAMKLLGFMFRTLKDFNNIFALKNVYCAIVRSTLEYACTVWSPYYKTHIELLEKVQRRFLRHIAYKLHIPSDKINYEYLSLLLGISSLEQRRRNYDLCFLFKLLNGLIDCSELLAEINFHVPLRPTRQANLFSVGYHRTNYGYFCPISRMCREANELPMCFDFFNMSFAAFKSGVNRL